MSGDCSSVCSPAMVLVKGRMFYEVLKDVKFQGHQPCIVGLKLDHPPGVPSACIKGVLL